MAVVVDDEEKSGIGSFFPLLLAVVLVVSSDIECT